MTSNSEQNRIITKISYAVNKTSDLSLIDFNQAEYTNGYREGSSTYDHRIPCSSVSSTLQCSCHFKYNHKLGNEEMGFDIPSTTLFDETDSSRVWKWLNPPQRFQSSNKSCSNIDICNTILESPRKQVQTEESREFGKRFNIYKRLVMWLEIANKNLLSLTLDCIQ